jgi:hypothetical protein
MNLLLTIAIAISMVVLLVASLLIVLAALLSITSTEPFDDSRNLRITSR